MERELLTYPLADTELRAELAFTLEHLRESGFTECKVLFGFAWGIEYYPDDQWVSETLLLTSVLPKVAEVEGRGIGRIGSDDLYLEFPSFSIIAPPLTYSQWLAAGERQGYLTQANDEPLPRALRLLAICLEREDVEASDVAQALFRSGTYTLMGPVVDASYLGHNVAELYELLTRAAAQYNYPMPKEDV